LTLTLRVLDVICVNMCFYTSCVVISELLVTVTIWTIIVGVYFVLRNVTFTVLFSTVIAIAVAQTVFYMFCGAK